MTLLSTVLLMFSIDLSKLLNLSMKISKIEVQILNLFPNLEILSSKPSGGGAWILYLSDSNIRY